MAAPPGSPTPASASPRRRIWALGAVLACAGAAAYAGTFRVPLLLDDAFSIVENPSIRSLRDVGRILRPEGFLLACRPVLNFTFALNYAGGGTRVGGYHAVNLAVHLAAALALFGLVRRTLELPSLGNRFGRDALALATIIAALWMLHPLQTEAVTYITQRAESLMGMFYLLTLYAFVRGASGGARGWFAASAAACWLGMATKQVMVTAPILVLLYDRTFLSASFADALRRRPAVYASLASSWLLLALLEAISPVHDASVGFHGGVGAAAYALTESKAVALYAKLAFWPRPLVFDYGGREALLPGLAAAAPWLLLVAAGAAGTIVLWRRSRPLGFPAAAFFILLSPSSSVVPLAGQPIAEHRMYLPLAPLLALAAIALWSVGGRRALAFLAALAILAGAATWDRNRTYQSALALWTDTVAHAPASARGQNNLGNELARDPARLPEAVAHYRAALRISPDDANARRDLAAALSREAYALPPTPAGRERASALYEEALRLDPTRSDTAYDLANLLAGLPDRTAEAISRYEQAIRLRPDFAEAHDNLANLLVRTPGRVGDALFHYREAIRLSPGNPEARNNYALVLSALPGNGEEAIVQFREAIRLRPDFVEARANLGALYAGLGRFAEAIGQFEAAQRLDPGNSDYRAWLERLRAMPAR